MATIDTSQSKITNSIGVNKIQKKSIQIDMTPMVDLGFLLITFFIFTTTISTPVAMDLIFPKADFPPTHISKDGVLNILLNNKNAFVYEGNDISKIEKISYSEIRSKINNKKKRTKLENKENKFMVLIKPNENANYQQIINVLDEMIINDVKRYALVDIDKKEIEKINL
jgi:biopolymer transport protein ExbD